MTTIIMPPQTVESPASAHAGDTCRELIALLSCDCGTSRVHACRMLASLGTLARPALPALRDAAQFDSDRVSAAAEAAITAILQAIRGEEHAAAAPAPAKEPFLDRLLRALGAFHC